MLLAHADPKAADRLKEIKAPSMDTLMCIAEALRDLRCSEETYLVIDNYQLVGSGIPRELMSIFSMHGSLNLHMILITQNLEARPQMTFHNANIHTIDSSLFFFNKESTASLFRMEGILLAGEELDKVYASTEGWISAIRLQIMGYQQTGSFEDAADIAQLVENTIWNRLTPEEKDLLISVAVLDSFTVRQAALMTGKETLSEGMRGFIKSNDFIRFFPRENIYVIHGILRDYLKNQFDLQPDGFQKRILRIAEQCYADDSQLFTAAQFFYKIKDFDAILSLPFDGAYLANQREKSLLELAASIFSECPQETLCKYPFVLIMFAYAVLLGGDTDIFQKVCRLIGLSIEENHARLNPDELRRLQGEFSLLTSITAHNDIEKMAEGAIKAYAFLGGPSSVIPMDAPWTFGSVSILCLFWREPGKLDETLRQIDGYLPHYLRITHGYGAGADSAARAEALLMRGEDEQAEILCHRALYEARSRQQISICLCAELTLARIAILRGDAGGYFTAVQNIQNYAKENPHLHVSRMVDVCFSFLGVVLGTTDRAAQWLCNMESVKRRIYIPAIPCAQIIYADLLLKEKRYNEFCGISQAMLEMAKSANYLLPQVYHFIFLAIAKYGTGNAQEASENLTRALELALPDRVLLAFSLPWDVLDTLLMSARNAFFRREGGNLDALIALRKRQAKGLGMIRKALFQNKSPLTPREREVALLAKERFTKKEIADKLYISEMTVKTILQNIYSKLDVHSKAELSTMEI